VRAFVIFRDRISYAIPCCAALWTAGLDVTIVDHGSTYPGAVDWLHDCERDGIPVWYHGGGNPRDLWGRPQFREAAADGPYVVTDPDVIPDEGCPLDWPQHLENLVYAHNQPKVGLGLRVDDLPDHYPRKRQVLEWEQQYWQRQVADGVFEAGTDTTIAVNRALRGSDGHSLGGYRSGSPYLARHLAWYEDPSNLPEDVAYYYAHIQTGISFWTVGAPSCWGN